jgi:DNA repair protein RadA/Sms
MPELDRVTGGGFVRGSVLLMAGDPGIGKSTLLIQAAAALARGGHRTVYISGEEAVAQVRLRAERLGLGDAKVELAAETSVEDIIATLSEGKTPRLVIIDSIQTMWTDMIESAPGTVTQVRGSAQTLIRYAKKSGAAVILVGHVTKDGQIAGPRVVEHMVDAVLSFEGDGPHQFRILRAVKNRFGPTDEIGVFEMTGLGPARGRQSVRVVPLGARAWLARHRGVCRDRGNPAGAGRDPGAGGADLARHATPRRWSAGIPAGWRWCWPCCRPIAASISAATTSISMSREACGSSSRPPISPPPAALVSSLANAPLPADAVYFGEVSLSGAVRPVAQAAARLKEAQKLGFARAGSSRGRRHRRHDVRPGPEPGG